jgi:hypothetical protein
MNYEFLHKLNIKGLRFLKIIYFKNQNILIASKLYKSENNIKKYILYKYLLTNDNQLINDSETLLDFYNIENDYLIDLYKSLWCRNINIENNNCYLLIDFNKNRDNKYFESNNYLLETNDFITFTLVKKYNINNILHLEYSNNLFMSKLEKGNDQWGKYLFEFKVNEQIIKPYFDKYINYNEDNGHLLHDIYFDNENEKYKIIFSVLNKKNEYTIYESNSSDFIHFNNTLPINFQNFNDSKWFCFPSLIMYNNQYLLFLNQDDYGKESEPLLFRKKNILLDFLEEKFSTNYIITNQLNYEDNKKYIFLNELLKKEGNRYNDIINNNKNLNHYSTHSPSCIDLYDTLQELNIKENDSILDIGSGKGLALTIMNLFPFKKIKGIELSEKDYIISKQNLDILQINNVEISNINALDYNEYNNFDYLYFYNPFNEVIFEKIIKKINKLNIKIIYNNIHEKEINILNKYNFILIKKNKGINRDFYIFQHIIKDLKFIIDNNYIIKKNILKNNNSDDLIDFLYNIKKNNKIKKELNIQYFEKSGESFIQKTKHCYNNYLLDWNKLKYIPQAKNIFHILKNNYENLTNQKIEDIKLYPQIIHYPSNGGFLDKHYHNYVPQLIGQVLLLKNEENKKGGFYFYNDNKILDIYNDELINISNEHLINDLLIFRFNIGHGVFPSLNYKQTEMEWIDNKWIKDSLEIIPNINEKNGRWIAVLTQL